MVLELDHEAAGRLAGALLSGEPCAVLVSGLVLSTWSDGFGARLTLRARSGGARDYP